MKNKFAVQLMATKAALTKAEKDELTARNLTHWYMASAIALNAAFGFGRERIDKFRDTMNAVMDEFGGAIDDTDRDFAEGKLEQRYAQIMVVAHES